MPVINNYNYYDGSTTEKVPPQVAEKWIKDCIDQGEIALNRKSAKMLNDNRIIIRVGRKVYFVEVSLSQKIGFNYIN